MMKFSLKTDVTTSGAHEGLFISTGFFATGKEFGIPSPIGNSPVLLVPHQQLSLCSPNGHFNTEAEGQNKITSGNDRMGQRNEEAQSMPADAEIEMAETAVPIKLNLFGSDDGKEPPLNKEDTAAFVPPQKSQNQSHGGPMLCDTTTTTTTVEVFRAKPNNANFFQMPKGPLSTAKQSVELIPAEGPDYERVDRSETAFSGRINSPRSDLVPPKSLQWEDNWPNPSALLFGQRDFSAESFAPFSPPRQCSTPLHFDFADSQRSVPSHGILQMEPIVPPPFARQFADGDNDGLTTVLRRQRCDKSERYIRQRKIELNREMGEKKVPPRPPKRRDKTVPFWEDRKAPPRPPKPTECLRKSKSAGFIDQNLTHANAVRRAAATENKVKLYQTRDCLGRIVCEW